MAYVIARPADSIDLPGLSIQDIEFKLSSSEREMTSRYFRKYKNASNAKMDGDDDNGGKALLGHATKSLVASCHALILSGARHVRTRQQETDNETPGDLPSEAVHPATSYEPDEEEVEDGVSGAWDGDIPLDDEEYKPVEHTYDEDSGDEGEYDPKKPPIDPAEISAKFPSESESRLRSGLVDELAALAEGDDELQHLNRNDPIGATNDKSHEEWLKHVKKSGRATHTSRLQCLFDLYEKEKKAHPQDGVIICSSYKLLLDLVAVGFEERKIRPYRYDGTVPRRQRTRIQSKFQKDGAERPMLMTVGAGGLGLNLTAASTIIQLEVQWNHNTEKQMYSRAYHQGAKKDIRVYRLMAANGEIDQEMKKVQEAKMNRINWITSRVVKPWDKKHEIPALPEVSREDREERERRKVIENERREAAKAAAAAMREQRAEKRATRPGRYGLENATRQPGGLHYAGFL